MLLLCCSLQTAWEEAVGGGCIHLLVWNKWWIIFSWTTWSTKRARHLLALKIHYFSHFSTQLVTPSACHVKGKELHWERKDPGCLTVSQALQIEAEGILWSTFLVDSSRQDHTFRCAVLKELIKCLGNYIVFINCDLGTAPEQSISIEPVDSKQFPFPQSILLLFFLFGCLHLAKIPTSKSSKLRYWHNCLWLTELDGSCQSPHMNKRPHQNLSFSSCMSF